MEAPVHGERGLAARGAHRGEADRAAPVGEVLTHQAGRRQVVRVSDDGLWSGHERMPGAPRAVAQLAVLGRAQPLVEPADPGEHGRVHREVVAREERRRRVLGEVLAHDVHDELARGGGQVAGQGVDDAAADDGAGPLAQPALERDEPAGLGEAVVVGEREQLPVRGGRRGVARRAGPAVGADHQPHRHRPGVRGDDRRIGGVLAVGADDDLEPARRGVEGGQGVQAAREGRRPPVRRDDHGHARRHRRHPILAAMPQPLRVGVVGCGRIARLVHLPALARDPHAEVVAVADADPEARAAATALAPTAAAAGDLDAVLALEAVEAVVVCLPTAAHAGAAVAALEAGRHVYVEKPMATTTADARAVIAAWRAAGRVAAVGHNYRFAPAYQELRRALDAGRIGPPTAVRTAIGAARRELPAWKRAPATGGGALLDLVTHHADAAAFLFGAPVVGVRATVWSVATEDDTAMVELRLAGGPPVQCFATLAGVEEDRVEVHGPGGRLSFDRFRTGGVRHDPPRRAAGRRARLRRAGREAAHAARAVRAAAVPPPEPSFARALGAFVAAAREGRPASPGPLEGLHGVAVAEAAARSARSGGWELVDADPAAA